MNLEQQTELRNKVLKGLQKAVKQLKERAAKNGEYLIISRDGKIVRIRPENTAHKS